MLERAWMWTGRHLFLSYILKTVLKSLYKKYAFWIIKDTWSKTAFSYLYSSYSNLFQTEDHSNFPTQMLTVPTELEPTDNKFVLKLSFRSLYSGLQVEMPCYQHMLKPHWRHCSSPEFGSIWSQESRVCHITKATILFRVSHQ